MKLWTGPLLAAALGVAIACAAVGCTTTATTTAANPQQAAINATYTSYQGVDQSAQATDKALKAGVLSKADAQKALDGFTTAKAALDGSLAVLKAAAAAPAATAASGASK